MCGIAGFFSFSYNHDQGHLAQMAKSIARRGPDDVGYYLKDISSCRVGFVHQRLSIIDLSENGHQPMHSNHCSIVFNGEIYNYVEVRKELEDKGISFKTQSDTEVILMAYEYWGIDQALMNLRGMFAFSLIDYRNETAYLVRDRIGVKPLAYTIQQDCIAFGSTVTSLATFCHHKALDSFAVGHYLQTGYIPGSNSVYEAIGKIQPGNYLKFDLNNRKSETITYWSIYDIKPNHSFLEMNESDLLDTIESELVTSFNYRMVADVPVGVFLSGGFDSTAVLALLSKSNSNLSTYTIGFQDAAYDESPFAKQIATHFGAKHHELICTANDAQQFIPQIVAAYDEPFGDSSAIPTLMLSEFARKDVKVALSADGGDELFAGYPKHHEGLINIQKALGIQSLLKKSGPLFPLIKAMGVVKMPNNSKFKKLEKLLFMLRNDYDFHDVQALANNYISQSTLKSIDKIKGFEYGNYFRHHTISKNHVPSDPLNEVLRYDLSTYLVDDVLVKVDRASMFKSLEGREPFLDHKLIELIYSIPGNLKVKHGLKKYLLRSIVYRNIPKEMMDRPKKGFSVPVKHWMRGDLKELFCDTLSISNMQKEELLNQNQVIKLRDAYLKGDTSGFELLWYIFCYVNWLNRIDD